LLLTVQPRPPPTSTLFPYTTLFRSFDAAMVASEQEQQARGAAIAVAERMNAKEVEVERGGEHQRLRPFFTHPALPEFDHLGHRLDRKSTRLNSSHDQISYAVFCLKK